MMPFRACLPHFSPAILLLVLSCIEPYEPHMDNSALNLLVVDGFINATEKKAVVRLSHTQPISKIGDANPETDAIVSIDTSTGTSYSLAEQTDGEYTADDLFIDRNTVYTLHIKTFSGVEYVSDTIRIRATPPIDSLGFSISKDGDFLNVLVNTHDTERKTRYYSWDLTETYEYNSPDSSEYKFINKVAIPRTEEEFVFTCWRTEHPTNITIGTTARLKEDIITRHTITQIQKGSLKLSVRYSALVKQRAVSELEYTFLDEIRKTTENLGGIFGTMPFPVVGNIHRVNNLNEPVLGYFSGAEVTEKRLFIDFLEMPDDFRTLSNNIGCIFEQTCNIFPEPLTSGPQSCLPLELISENSIILRMVNQNSYIFTSPECGDCRAKGGVTTRPDFW